MEWGSVSGIAIDRSNDQGVCYFMNLLTRKSLHSKKWNGNPISDEVIAQVEKLADEKMLNQEVMEEL